MTSGCWGSRHTNVCFCPTTERDLADGIGPARLLHDAGATLTLGSDSHAVIDLFEEMRAVEMHERLASQRRGHWSAMELLAAATYDGHRSLGFDDAGRIAEGQRADLVTIDLESIRTRGAGAAPETIVFAATAADARTRSGGSDDIAAAHWDRRARHQRPHPRRHPARVCSTTPRSCSKAAGSPGSAGGSMPPTPTPSETSVAAPYSPASSTPTPTSSSPATGPRSSPPGWPGRATRPVASAPPWPRPAPRPTSSSPPTWPGSSPRCAARAPPPWRSRAATA